VSDAASANANNTTSYDGLTALICPGLMRSLYSAANAAAMRRKL